jgi:nucleoside-diphosphate kinase
MITITTRSLVLLVGVVATLSFLYLICFIGVPVVEEAPLVTVDESFTFAMIKPDAVRSGATGPIIGLIEGQGFKIVAMKKIVPSARQLERLYAEHAGRSFYPDLMKFMRSGPIVVMVLTKPDAVKEWRRVLGATNPAQAIAGSVRAQYGTTVTENAAHGSESPAAAAVEALIFFPELSSVIKR